jgi:hypothetical protein
LEGEEASREQRGEKPLKWNHVGLSNREEWRERVAKGRVHRVMLIKGSTEGGVVIEGRERRKQGVIKQRERRGLGGK